MGIELKMPALSPTMEKGTLAKWLIGVGDSVRRFMLAEVAPHAERWREAGMVDRET